MRNWNPVLWLRELQAAADPKKDVRPGLAADRFEELEAFVKSTRHALVLFDDGHKDAGETQLRASIAHLDRK